MAWILVASRTLQADDRPRQPFSFARQASVLLGSLGLGRAVPPPGRGEDLLTSATSEETVDEESQDEITSEGLCGDIT